MLILGFAILALALLSIGIAMLTESIKPLVPHADISKIQ